jgi:hypothetical protein
MLNLHWMRDVAVLETASPWAFRPGDLIARDHDLFRITRVVHNRWFWFRRRRDRFVVYGTPNSMADPTDA